MPIKDTFIAATALAHDLAVVTLNVRDFDAAAVAIVDPVAESGH
jgi:predicted nucleic acid-binding protein